MTYRRNIQRSPIVSVFPHPRWGTAIDATELARLRKCGGDQFVLGAGADFGMPLKALKAKPPMGTRLETSATAVQAIPVILATRQGPVDSGSAIWIHAALSHKSGRTSASVSAPPEAATNRRARFGLAFRCPPLNWPRYPTEVRAFSASAARCSGVRLWRYRFSIVRSILAKRTTKASSLRVAVQQIFR